MGFLNRVNAYAIQLKRGLAANINSLATRNSARIAEFHYTTDTKDVYIFDGTSNLLIGQTDAEREIRIFAYHVEKGVSAPTESTRAVGVSGSVLMPVLQFSKTSQNDVYFVFHSPEDMDWSLPAHFHLMWQPGASWTAGNFLWKLEYLVLDGNGATLLSGTPITISKDITPVNATTNREDSFVGDIVLTVDQIMISHFYRDTANDNGNDVGSVLAFELHYISNKRGE